MSSKRMNGSDSASQVQKQPQRTERTDAPEPLPGPPVADSLQQQQSGGSNTQQQPGDTQLKQAPRQQPHSEPLPVPGNSRVDSAPDADDDGIDPERL